MPRTSVGKFRDLAFSQDSVQRCFRLRHIQPAQRIIGAQPDNEAAHLISQRPVQPGQPIGGRVTGNPGVNDCEIGMAGLKCRLQLCRKGISQLKSKARGEAVAQHQKRHRLGESRVNGKQEDGSK